jgi:activator of 2-hydroxyglutaryl-CoA dehydratase
MAGDTSREDAIAAVFRLVGAVVGTISCLAARATGFDEVVMIGALSKMEPIVLVVKEVFDLYNLSLMIPPFSEFAVAVGAAIRVKGDIEP